MEFRIAYVGAFPDHDLAISLSVKQKDTDRSHYVGQWWILGAGDASFQEWRSLIPRCETRAEDYAFVSFDRLAIEKSTTGEVCITVIRHPEIDGIDDFIFIPPENARDLICEYLRRRPREETVEDLRVAWASLFFSLVRGARVAGTVSTQDMFMLRELPWQVRIDCISRIVFG